MPIKFRSKETGKKLKEIIIKRITDPGNPYTKPKPVIELNKAFSVVMDQKMFAEGKVVLKRLRTASNPYRVRVPKQTPRNQKVIELAESTKPTKAHARLIRVVNKPKAAALETLAKSTGLPSIEKKAAQARELTTRAGSSRKAVESAGNAVKTTKKAKQVLENTVVNPGHVGASATEKFIENPIASSGFVLGKFQLASSNPAVVAFPTTVVAGAAEGGAKKIPLYKHLTTDLAKKFHNSRSKSLMEKGINIGANMVRVGLA